MDEPMDKPIVIPVLEEQVDIDKRRVEHGGVRITPRVHQRPFEQRVELREERLTVERRRVDRPAITSDLAVWRQARAVYRERAQLAVVARRAHVTEEVVVEKAARDERQTIRDHARSSDVQIRPLEAES